MIFPIKLEKLGLSGAIAEREVEVVNLKVEPTEMVNLLSKDGIFPSYHVQLGFISMDKWLIRCGTLGISYQKS